MGLSGFFEESVIGLEERTEMDSDARIQHWKDAQKVHPGLGVIRQSIHCAASCRHQLLPAPV